LISERRPCDAALSLAERIEINLAEALSRTSSIGAFWAISVRLPDPQIIDFPHLSGRCDPAWKNDPLRRGIGVQD
jgi:hypothetical protein